MFFNRVCLYYNKHHVTMNLVTVYIAYCSCVYTTNIIHDKGIPILWK